MKVKFSYGDVFGKPSAIFREDYFKKLGIVRLFSNKNLLDLGCGFALDSVEFAKFAKTVIAADAISYKSWLSIKSKKIKFIKTYSEKLPFKTNQFNAVYMKDLLHHVDNVDKTLEEVRRVSAKGATVVILEGNRYNPLFYFLVTKLKNHQHFTQNEFKQKILKYFPNANFKHFDAYPPFFLNEKMYRFVLLFQRLTNKVDLLKPFFTYNAAVIKVKK